MNDPLRLAASFPVYPHEYCHPEGVNPSLRGLMTEGSPEAGRMTKENKICTKSSLFTGCQQFYNQTNIYQNITNSLLQRCVGKPEKVRTSPFLVAPIWPCVAGGQKGQGCLFRTLFLWLLFFGGAKESNKHESNKHENNKKERDGAPFETPS